MCCGRPLIKKIVLVFICCRINWSFEQALQDIVDSYFSIPVYKPGQQYVKRARLSLLETKKLLTPDAWLKWLFLLKGHLMHHTFCSWIQKQVMWWLVCIFQIHMSCMLYFLVSSVTWSSNLIHHCRVLDKILKGGVNKKFQWINSLPLFPPNHY